MAQARPHKMLKDPRVAEIVNRPPKKAAKSAGQPKPPAAPLVGRAHDDNPQS